MPGPGTVGPEGRTCGRSAAPRRCACRFQNLQTGFSGEIRPAKTLQSTPSFAEQSSKLPTAALLACCQFFHLAHSMELRWGINVSPLSHPPDIALRTEIRQGFAARKRNLSSPSEGGHESKIRINPHAEFPW